MFDRLGCAGNDVVLFLAIITSVALKTNLSGWPDSSINYNYLISVSLNFV